MVRCLAKASVRGKGDTHARGSQQLFSHIFGEPDFLGMLQLLCEYI